MRERQPIWTDEQVKNANDYQHSGIYHPYTGECGRNGEKVDLIATPHGWVGYEGGPVFQTVASQFVLSGAWRPEPGTPLYRIAQWVVK